MKESYFLVRGLFLRMLAFVYSVAFLVAYNQNKALIGDKGITPACKVLKEAKAREETVQKQYKKKKSKEINHNRGWISATILKIRKFFLWDRRDEANHIVTTLLWLAKDHSHLNPWLDGIALCGLLCSQFVMLTGFANVPLLLVLCICQRSVWAVGGEWYAYGWEPLLAELGFHSLFLVPFFFQFETSSHLHKNDVPITVVWSLRWFLFRVMLGAGLIKIKGSKHWKDLTAMQYFYETQPVPNCFSKYFHMAPRWWHTMEVLGNHIVELAVPWLLLMPNRTCRIVGGVIQILFQILLILSGNLSFLNWLTIIPALFCFDDAFLCSMLSHLPLDNNTVSNYMEQQQQQSISVDPSMLSQVVIILYSVLVGGLSLPVICNFFSSHQVMIGSFDPYQIVNTFGAFGSVSEERIELIVSSAMEINGEWREYEFPVKPGNPTRCPRWISPYHYRLDWQMWIAAQLGTINASPWMYRFLIKLLEADEEVLQMLLAGDPWNGQRPKWIKVEQYRYKINNTHHTKKQRSNNINKSHHDNRDDRHDYWEREYISRFYPRLGKGATLESLWSQVDRTGH